MRKLLSIFLVSAATASAPVAAQPAPATHPVAVAPIALTAEVAPPPFQLVTSLFSRYEVRAGYREIGLVNSDQFRYRARVGLQSAPLDIGNDLKVSIRFLPESSGTWHVGGDSLDDASLGLHEGYVSLHGNSFRVDAGRLELAYGDHLMIGNVDWTPGGRAFDGARVHVVPSDKLWIDGFFAVTEEGSASSLTTPFSNGDSFFSGIYAGLGGLIDPKFALDAYVLGLVSPKKVVAGVTTDPKTRFTVGARVKNRSGMLDYRVELGMQFGSDAKKRDALAYQGDLEVGVNLFDDVLRIGAEGLIASGDDPSSADTNEGWNQMFPTAHKWLGFADVIGFGGRNGSGRNNIASGVFHLSVKPTAAWLFYLDGHIFARPEDVVLAAAVPGETPTTLESGVSAGEIDVGGSYLIGAGLKVRTNYSVFLPQDAWYRTTDPAHFFELELRYDH